MNCVTTDEALEILDRQGLLPGVMERLVERMEFYVDHRSGHSLERGILVFSQTKGTLGKSKGADRLLEQLGRELG